jgi:hypothetical protein
MSDNERAQREGYLSVVYSVQVDIASMFNKMHTPNGRLRRMRECLPMRPSAVHCCYNDIRLLPFISLYQQFIGTHGRVRFRTHFGSHTECQHALMSFGIMPDCLPVDAEGNKNCISWNQWIEKRKILESERIGSFLHRSLLEFELSLDSPDTLQMDGAQVSSLLEFEVSFGSQGTLQMDRAQDISLLELEFDLSNIKKKPAYDKAKFLWPTSVTDPSFCLQFLRAANFNPCDAARLLLESLPWVDLGGGKLGLADLMLWLEKRKTELQAAHTIASSSSSDDTHVIYFPSVNDILLGRGFAYQNFPGNQYFISFLEREHL